MQKDFEERLLSLIKNSDAYSEIISYGITKDSFAVHREKFEFIAKYYGKYGNVPSAKIMQANFPDFVHILDVKSDEQKYLIDELVKGETKRKAIKILNSGADLMEADTYGAIEYLVSKLLSVRATNKKFSKSYTDKNALLRLESFRERKQKINSGITVGLKTGLSIFDDKMLGWHPGDLIAIVGRTGLGKSWLSLFLCGAAYINGSRVAYLSPEMSVEEVEMRWDTVLATMYGMSVPNTDLYQGKVDESKYKEWLEKAAQRNDWLTMDSDIGKSFTLDTVQSTIDEFNPDMICIDGFLLMESASRSEKTWESMRNLALGLKSIAQNNKVVILVTSQAGREAANNIPGLHQIYGGDSLAQTANVTIMMSDDPDEAKVRYITIPKRRSGGQAINKKIKIHWDVNLGVIGI